MKKQFQSRFLTFLVQTQTFLLKDAWDLIFSFFKNSLCSPYRAPPPIHYKKNGIRISWQIVYVLDFWAYLSVVEKIKLRRGDGGNEGSVLNWVVSQPKVDFTLFDHFCSNSELSAERSMRKRKFFFSLRCVWCAAKTKAIFPTKSRERPWENDFKVVLWRFWFRLKPFYWTGHEKKSFLSLRCVWCAAKPKAIFPTKSRGQPWNNDFKLIKLCQTIFFFEPCHT